MVTRKYTVWYFVVVILAFVSHARADDADIASLFAPVVSKNEAAVTVAVPGTCQEFIVNTALLKSTREEQDRIRLDFLDQRILVKRTKILPGPQGSVTWMGKPENAAGSVLMAVLNFARIRPLLMKWDITWAAPMRMETAPCSSIRGDMYFHPICQLWP